VIDRLRTPRTVLRRWLDDDLRPFAEMNADPAVMEFFPATLSAIESATMVERIEQSFEVNGFGLWALEVDGRFAGFTGLNRTTFDTPMGPHVEIGWRLARWAWGHGYATEAAGEVLRDGFERVGLAEIFSFTTVTNVRSRAVMERLGMQHRAELDFDHPRTPGWWGQRHVVYHLAAGDGRVCHA
jgi:ribosomal-protein-alanine N-acetyltransferase